MNVAPQGRYPMGCLAITIDPKLVDVNVHPRKEEVRFMNPRIVEQLIQTSVKTCLEENIAKRIPAAKNTFSFAQVPMSNQYHSTQPSLKTSAGTAGQAIVRHSLSVGGSGRTVETDIQTTTYQPFNFDAVFPEPQEWNTSDTAAPKTTRDRYAKNSAIIYAARFSQAPRTDYILPTKVTFKMNQEEAVQTAIAHDTITHDATTVTEEPYTLIGQYHKTYILIEQEEGLFIIDQHAAHERILYELFAHRFTEVATVQLLFPVLITLSHDDIRIIEPYLPLFVQNGIAIELFGANQLKIQATPVHLKDASLDDLIKQTIGWVNEYKYLDEQQFIKKLHEKLRAQMACKAAVKAGDILTHAHMQQLLTTLHATENRLTCPHGRPTGWLLSNHDIEKKFKRKL